MYDSKELLQDFIIEAKEHLETIEPNIFALEKEPDRQKEILNEIFRPMHSLKGASGFLGLQKINSLAHIAESVMDELRKGNLELTPEIIDTILSTTGVLERIIYNIEETEEEGDIDILPAKSALEEILSSQATPIRTAPTAETTTTFLPTLEEYLPKLVEEPNTPAYIDAIYTALCSTVTYAEQKQWENIASTAKNTADIIEKSKKNETDFSFIINIIEQEIEIIIDLLKQYMEEETKGNTQELCNSTPAEQIIVPVEPKSTTPTEHAPIPKQEQERVEENAPNHEVQATAKNQDEKKEIEKEKIKQTSFIRVDQVKLDHLMNLIGELIITRNRYALLVRLLEKEENERIAEIAQNLAETTSTMDRISDSLQDTIMQVRMVSLSGIFSRLPRLVRDISKKSGKDVELIIHGEDTELDKNMVESLADPLLHLIRNAVDHGIEKAEDRIAQGKSKTGTVTVRAFHLGNSVAIEIQDDGKGMNPQRLREIAVEKSLLTKEEAYVISDTQAFDLIFLPGFSGAKEITDISGRGVGMDVVRTNINALKGNIQINSIEGKGSTFTMLFPLTLAIIEALMVVVEQQIFAIPLDTVLETTKITKDMIQIIQGTEAITLRGEVISIAQLYQKLGFPKREIFPEVLSVVIVSINGKKIGLVVDTLLERQEVVIKSLGDAPISKAGISSATITGDGGVILILNPHELLS